MWYCMYYCRCVITYVKNTHKHTVNMHTTTIKMRKELWSDGQCVSQTVAQTTMTMTMTRHSAPTIPWSLRDDRRRAEPTDDVR